MKRIYTLLLLLVSALVWVGCSYEPAPELRRAELLLEGRPDSILNVLKAVDRDSLPSDRDRAYHAVLLNWAYVENFKELKDDSLIHQALEFYRQHGPDSMLMQSIYLSGLTDQQRHRGISSMRKAEEGFKMAEKADNPYWMGKFALMMTAGFEYSYNAVEALQYAERSAAYFKKAGRTRNYYDSMIKIITYNNTLKNYRRADELIDSMLSLEDIKKDRRLRNIYIGNRLYRQICTGDYDGAKVSADTLLKYYSENELDSYSYWYLAKIAGHEKRYDDMKRYLDMGSAKMQYSGDTLAMIDGWFAYYNGLKDSANLIHCYDSCLRMQSNLVLNVMKQSGVTEQRNMARIDLLESERRRTRDTAILAAVICLITIAAVILWICMNASSGYRKQKQSP